MKGAVFMSKKREDVDLLLDIMNELSYYQSKEGLCATIQYGERKNTVLVESSDFMDYIFLKYHEITKEYTDDIEIKKRLKLIRCMYREQYYDEHIFEKRYGYDSETIYINMANDKLEHIEVDKEGFRIEPCKDDTPLFVRDSMQNPMVEPKETASDNLLEDLDCLINLSEDDKFIYKIWLIASMNPIINTPILYLLGKAGNGKSFMQYVLNDLLDPSKRGLVNWDDASMKEISIALDRSYVVNYDNVSKIKQQRSDLLCQSVTGGNSSYRKLYSDNEEISYNLRSRVTISSIENCIVRDDLAQRTLFLNVPVISRKSRINETEIKEMYEERKAGILADMLNILSMALSMYDEWKDNHQSYHRLASFEIFGSLIAYILEEDEGYERFKQIMREKHMQQIFLDEQEALFMASMLTAVFEEGETSYKGSTKRLYDITVEWITDSPDCENPDIEIMNYDKFSKMIHRHKEDFLVLGYEVGFYRITDRNIAGVKIKKLKDDNII